MRAIDCEQGHDRMHITPREAATSCSRRVRAHAARYDPRARRRPDPGPDGADRLRRVGPAPSSRRPRPPASSISASGGPRVAQPAAGTVETPGAALLSPRTWERGGTGRGCAWRTKSDRPLDGVRLRQATRRSPVGDATGCGTGQPLRPATRRSPRRTFPAPGTPRPGRSTARQGAARGQRRGARYTRARASTLVASSLAARASTTLSTKPSHSVIDCSREIIGTPTRVADPQGSPGKTVRPR